METAHLAAPVGGMKTQSLTEDLPPVDNMTVAVVDCANEWLGYTGHAWRVPLWI
jgi:hypothetical protein